MQGDMRAWLFEEQWQVDWLRATALLAGWSEEVRSYMATLYHPMLGEFRGTVLIYTQDPLPNATVDKEVLAAFLTDPVQRQHFIDGKKDEFFADSPA